jgi:hypothetical protein
MKYILRFLLQPLSLDIHFNSILIQALVSY